MKSRRRNVPEDRETILRRHSNSINTDEYSTPIPHDLIIEILSRLPAKSVARCRCVSKLWASVLGLPDFTETYLTRSSARPQVLFACEKDGKVFFFSSPQPQNPDDKSSPIATAANYHMNFHFDRVFDIYSPMSGLVCIRDDRILKGRKTPAMVWEICNPSTGQSFTLPRMKSRKRTGAISFFGYDPTEKQFKVLSMFMENAISKEHQVLTFARTGKVSLRMIECCIPHYPGSRGICINGVLYYKASSDWLSKNIGIMCFDVRSETFRFIQVMEPFTRVVHPQATLINYKGKLASVMSGWYNYIGQTDTSFVMYVLQDPEKQEWSKHIYELAPLWKQGVAKLFFVGVTDAHEIVLSPHYPSDPFYVFYYSLERKTIRRVEIQGMGEFKQLRVYTFVNHVEDVKLMQAF